MCELCYYYLKDGFKSFQALSESGMHMAAQGNHTKGVRQILLRGIFWRILIIEGILLIWSLAYRLLTDHHAMSSDLVWYALRIVVLIAVIIGFIMVTFKVFLTKKIIQPLETIVSANQQLRENIPSARQINLPEETPKEIQEIVSTRAQMLDDIFKVSNERLNLVNFIKDTFGRYLSKKVVDEILESPEGQKVGGRRETVTILISDLRGFTSLSETKDPEEMVQLLNRYLERMTKVILKYDGMIDEFIGDAILTVFGVPEKRDDDPARAVACGLAMQNALRVLNEEMVEEGYPPLEMGIGINTGSVIVGNIGSEVRVKYGIVGAGMNMASRIESNSTGDQVLIGETTYEAVKETVTTQPAQTVMMKGLRKPLVYYPVVNIGAPYHITIQEPVEDQKGVKISLPFSCWKIEEKKIAEDPIFGETLQIGENFFYVMTEKPITPLTDVKLNFNFCTDAHCFDDIYAKVIDIDPEKENTVIRLRITSMNPEDKQILNKWIKEVS